MKITIGKKFGNLIIIDNSPSYRSRSKRTNKLSCQKRYLSKCVCGNLRIISRFYLKRAGKKASCVKCAIKNRPQSLNVLSKYQRLYLITKNAAKQRKYSFNLTLKQYEKIVVRNCKYCGSAPRLIKWGNGKGIIANGIDRVNNAKGYILYNCVPCCKNCNVAKAQLTKKNFFKLIKNIYINSKLS